MKSHTVFESMVDAALGGLLLGILLVTWWTGVCPVQWEAFNN